MKKILSIALALSMIIALAVPALAYDPTDSTAIEKVQFDKPSYNWADIDADRDGEGLVSISLDKLLTAYDANGNRVAFSVANGESEIDENKVRFAVTNTNLATVSGKFMTLKAGKGATITLQAITSKNKIASTVIKLPGVATVGEKATFYTVADKTIEIGKEGKFTPVPTPLNSEFTAEQIAGFEYWVSTPGSTEWNKVTSAGATLNGFTASLEQDENGKATGKLIVSADNSVVANEVIKVMVRNVNMPNAQSYKYFNIKATAPAGEAVAPALPAEIEVEVGSIIDLSKYEKDSKWEVLPYGENQDETITYQMAKILSDNQGRESLFAIAPGVVTVKATRGDKSDITKVIIGKGNATPSLAESAEIKVGTQVKLEVKNLPQGVTVNWTIDNNNVSIEPYAGSYTIVRGKKVGTTKVTAKLSTGEVLTSTITVKDGGSKPVNPGQGGQGTTNPPTGDSIFANLF